MCVCSLYKYLDNFVTLEHYVLLCERNRCVCMLEKERFNNSAEL